MRLMKKMNKKNSKLPVFVALTAWEAYRFYKGRGIFNKIRYKKQHEAVSNYMGTHYPNAFYSDIAETCDGWSCVVTTNSKKIMLHMTLTEGGTFVFWEKEI